MKERIQFILSDKKLSATRFAEILQVQPSSISHLLSGRNKPSIDFIIKFLERFPDINPDWFLLGTGEVYRSPLRDGLFGEKKLSLPGKEKKTDSPKENEYLTVEDPTRKIERIIVFYTDKTFSVYTEEDKL